MAKETIPLTHRTIESGVERFEKQANKGNRNLTAPGLITAAERRRFEIALREQRYSYALIAEATIKRFGVDSLPKGYDARYACSDVNDELRKWRREMKEDLDSIMELEMRNLDQLENAHMAAAMRGNHRSTEVILRIKETRAKLLGLNAPVQVKVDYKAELVHRVQLGEITIDQLRAELGDEYTEELLRNMPIAELPDAKLSDNEITALPEGDVVDAEFKEITGNSA